MGAVIGRLCACVARNYDRLMGAGYYPDSASLYRAVCATLAPGRAPIIWADKVQWSLAQQAAPAVLFAVMLAGLYLAHGMGLSFVLFACASASLLLLACIDARTCLLPDAVTLPLLWLGLVCAWANIGISLHDSIFGVIVGYGLPAILRGLWLWWRGIEGVGQGDIKLLAALGAWLGPLAGLSVLLLACLAGVLFAIIHQRCLRPRGSYPFGPFLALAGMAAFLAPSAVQSWFWS